MRSGSFEMVRLFSFFSMIKRVLQPSKSMLSSNLCETWDLILNESIMKLLELFRFQRFLIVYKSNKQETLIPYIYRVSHRLLSVGVGKRNIQKKRTLRKVISSSLIFIR